jgi:hypothetical protein
VPGSAYRQEKRQATIWATITTATPRLVKALAGDPRTANDNPCGNLANAPIAASDKFANAGPARKLTIEVTVDL